MLRILIADDHALVRHGLRRILTEELPEISVGEAASCAETIEKVRAERWNAVILDISLPDRNGIEVLGELAALGVNIPVLVLSMYPEKQFAARAFRSGAKAYLTKEAAPEELVKALREVMAGRKYVSTSSAMALVAGITTSTVLPHESLSERERLVFDALVAGESITEIAERLALSAKTVSTYRARVSDKLGLRTVAEFTRYAVELGLVPSPPMARDPAESS